MFGLWVTFKSPRREKQTHQFSELNADFLNEPRIKSQDTIKCQLVMNGSWIRAKSLSNLIRCQCPVTWKHFNKPVPEGTAAAESDSKTRPLIEGRFESSVSTGTHSGLQTRIRDGKMTKEHEHLNKPRATLLAASTTITHRREASVHYFHHQLIRQWFWGKLLNCLFKEMSETKNVQGGIFKCLVLLV